MIQTRPWLHMPPTSLLFLFLFISLCMQTHAIFENEAGAKDWHQKWIGKPVMSTYHTDASGIERLIVGTQRNVISLLDISCGDIIWRQVFRDKDPLALIRTSRNALISLSNPSASTVRLWDITSGFLVWEHTDEEGHENLVEHGVGTDAIFMAEENADVIALIGGNRVKKLDIRDGSLKWAFVNHGSETVLLRVFKQHERLYLVGATKGFSAYSLCIIILDPETGKNLDEISVQSNIKNLEDVIFLNVGNDGYIIWTEKNNLKAKKLGTSPVESVTLKDVYGPEFAGLDFSNIKLIAAEQGSFEFVIEQPLQHGSFAATIFKIDGPTGQIVRKKDMGTREARSHIASSGEFFARSYQRDKGDITIEVWDSSKSLEPISTISFVHNFSLTGDIESTTFTITSSFKFQLFVTTKDGSIRTFTESGILWSREESLAHTIQAELLDLPEERMFSQEVDELAEQPEKTEAIDPLTRYARRWSTHIKELKYLPDRLLAKFNIANVASPNTNITILEAQSSLSQPAVAQNLYRDVFGLRKLAISVTTTGKVVAQDTGAKGKIVWARYFDEVIFERIFIVRAAIVKFPPVIVVTGQAFNEEGRPITVIYRLDGITGNDYIGDFGDQAEASTLTWLPSTIQQVFQLPISDPLSRLQLLVFVDQEKIYLYPSTYEAQKVFEEFAPKFYFSRGGEIGSTGLGGYRALGVGKTGVYNTIREWTLNFPDQDAIAAIGRKPSHEKIASIGRVLGNRNVMYKYLNSHLLAVATVNPDLKTLKIYLIDIVKGAILYQIVHKNVGVELPVHVIQSENTVVYHFWLDSGGIGSPGKGWQVVVLELYESLFENERVSTQNFSSFNDHQPAVLSAAFMFPYGITAIGVTSTRNGITTREFLFGTTTNQIFGVNKRLLDPRRPRGPLTADDKEEMLLPYQPVIYDEKRMIISYHLSIIGINSIITSPSSLESTSMVLAYGLDTYFTKSSPSKQFDVLSEEFSKTQLILTIVVLGLGVVITNPLVKRKMVNSMWQ